jgi:hypothetical protein
MLKIDYGFNVFRDRETAQALAASNAADDPDAEYRVVEKDDGRFVVAIFEDGEFVANL